MSPESTSARRRRLTLHAGQAEAIAARCNASIVRLAGDWPRGLDQPGRGPQELRDAINDALTTLRLVRDALAPEAP